jgi:hypothetical protein
LRKRERLSVLHTGYQMIFEKERERETSVLYASYQVMFERERFSVCRFCINISCGIISDVIDWIT